MQQCIYFHICITNWVKKILETQKISVTGRKTLFDVTMEVKVKFLCDGQQNLYKSSLNAVGYELFSTECFELLPNEIKKLPMGVILELPDSLYVQVAEKSSVSLCGLRVLTEIIDPDYRAQIFLVLRNITNQEISWDKTKPMAQLIFHSSINPCIIKTENTVEETFEGSKGFGECTELKHQF